MIRGAPERCGSTAIGRTPGGGVEAVQPKPSDDQLDKVNTLSRFVTMSRLFSTDAAIERAVHVG